MEGQEERSAERDQNRLGHIFQLGDNFLEIERLLGLFAIFEM